MDNVKLTILFGRQRIEIDAAPTDELSSARRKAEDQLGLVDGGLRLLFKGKSVSDNSTIQSAGITSNTKLMALRTQKQHATDRDKEKRQKLQQQQKELLDIKSGKLKACQTESESASPASSSSSSGSKSIMGDQLISDTNYIIIQKGRDRYRINVDSLDNMKVEQVKGKLSLFISGIEPRDVRLLSKGKVLKDSMTLEQSNVKNASTIMALFSARYHDRNEAQSEIEKYSDQVMKIESEHTKIQKRIKHRLIPGDELVVTQAQFRQDVQRIRDNIEAVHGHDDAKAKLQKRLDNLDTDFTGS